MACREFRADISNNRFKYCSVLQHKFQLQQLLKNYVISVFVPYQGKKLESSREGSINFLSLNPIIIQSTKLIYSNL